MVNSPESAPADEVPIEWRRHYYDASDGHYVAAALIAAVAFVPLFTGAILADHRSMALVWGGAAIMMAGSAWMLLFRSGTLGERPNSAVFDDGAFRVSAQGFRQPLLGAVVGIIGMSICAVGLLAAEKAGEVFLLDEVRTALWVALALMVGLLALLLWSNPFGRQLVFAPDGFTFRIGATSGEIPWSSIVDIRTHRGGERRMLFPGRIKDSILISVSTDRFRVQLIGFDVDEDTLYNVIAALHAHPQLRELAGREEGRVLFDGPKRSLRKRLRRTEVWLPWERGVHAALAGGPGPASGDRDRRDLTDHA